MEERGARKCELADRNRHHGIVVHGDVFGAHMRKETIGKSQQPFVGGRAFVKVIHIDSAEKLERHNAKAQSQTEMGDQRVFAIVRHI